MRRWITGRRTIVVKINLLVLDRAPNNNEILRQNHVKSKIIHNI